MWENVFEKKNSHGGGRVRMQASSIQHAFALLGKRNKQEEMEIVYLHF